MEKVDSPLLKDKRLRWIDASRGFAILGILMVNLPAFNGPFFLYGGGENYWSSSVDPLIRSLIDIFFQASFYTLFSFLFGFGIQIIVEKLTQKQLEVGKTIFRRLFILIGFGLIHAFVIWHGDILLSYGIIGLLLLAFFKRKNITLLGWAFGLLLIPTVLYTFLLYLVRDQLDFVNDVAIQAAFQNYGNGSLVEIWQQNYYDWSYGGVIYNYFFLIIGLLPLFLLGMVTARKRWLHHVQKYRAFLNKVWWVTLSLFLFVKVGPHMIGNPSWMSSFQDNIGGTASALFYIVSITLAYQNSTFKRFLKPLEKVGRMSLTNYILQSIICFLLFYSVGFGLYGKVSPLASIGLVMIIFTVQILFSHKWLKHFRFGPLEGLWRSLTYQQKLPLKRNQRREEEL
ncbi:DUF418 domain-containing protein [Aquibacillus sediminis]|uniref:DUF418 domain-containing protein n=1 Tax=Aquibacillus sediminis TaxID=2574734 RepID=UPI00110989FF|nr:DUF418 domain-containing protein [Aquibacillus sediminis]